MSMPLRVYHRPIYILPLEIREFLFPSVLWPVFQWITFIYSNNNDMSREQDVCSFVSLTFKITSAQSEQVKRIISCHGQHRRARGFLPPWPRLIFVYLLSRYVQFKLEDPGDEVYSYTNWWAIDSFCYFSHYLVTVPPICWVNAGHAHGVQILGTYTPHFHLCGKPWRKVLTTVILNYGFRINSKNLRMRTNVRI